MDGEAAHRSSRIPMRSPKQCESIEPTARRLVSAPFGIRPDVRVRRAHVQHWSHARQRSLSAEQPLVSSSITVRPSAPSAAPGSRTTRPRFRPRCERAGDSERATLAGCARILARRESNPLVARAPRRTARTPGLRRGAISENPRIRETRRKEYRFAEELHPQLRKTVHQAEAFERSESGPPNRSPEQSRIPPPNPRKTGFKCNSGRRNDHGPLDQGQWQPATQGTAFRMDLRRMRFPSRLRRRHHRGGCRRAVDLRLRNNMRLIVVRPGHGPGRESVHPLQAVPLIRGNRPS